MPTLELPDQRENRALESRQGVGYKGRRVPALRSSCQPPVGVDDRYDRLAAGDGRVRVVEAVVVLEADRGAVDQQRRAGAPLDDAFGG